MLKENRRLIQIALIAIVSILLIVLSAFYIFSGLENKLIEEKKQICLDYARVISGKIEADSRAVTHIQRVAPGKLSRDSTTFIDNYFSRLLDQHLSQFKGLEGGLYISGLDEFMGYAFPTSPPPVPVYGPPPRSHEIIRSQIIRSIQQDNEIIDVHAFDPAVFPLATVLVHYENRPIGALWIRVHIERELPVARLKRIINFVTILSLFGFLVMALISFFLRNGIKNIRKELKNTHNNPGYRLKKRGGWFGFIPASINDMLGMLEKENRDRVELEKRLQQKEKMASLGKMIAGVAHEVKTPLSVVKTRVQMWEKDVLESEEMQQKITPDSMKLVLDEINRLSQLVKRLVVFSRPIHKNLKPTNIEQLLEEVISMIDLSRTHQNIRFIKQYDRRITTIEVDGNTIRQVLINVINNSIESIGSNGSNGSNGEISIRTTFNENLKLIAIEISDNGTGIPDDFMNQIFEPFFTSKETGTGLGLTISNEIIAAHNGNISFTNLEKGGLLCTIELPVSQ